MEKFGIFNILSALNSLTSGGAGGQKEQKTDSSAAEPQKTDKKVQEVFNPPPYPPAYKPMLDILARHEEISKRIDKNTEKKK